jgi:isoprenylcysteine carboxyl methyltransferase (ICMT) family protein YpbQ
MVKRIASSGLWFLAVAWGWNYFALLADLPSAVGLVLASSVAAYVCLDPLHRVWQTRLMSPPMLPGRTEQAS